MGLRLTQYWPAMSNWATSGHLMGPHLEKYIGPARQIWALRGISIGVYLDPSIGPDIVDLGLR